MIIDIALGIVLAVFILRYWPAIVALGIIAVIGFVLLAFVGVGIYFIASNEAVLQKVLTVLTLVAVFLVGSFVSQLIAQRTVLKSEEVGVLLTIAIFLTVTTLFFAWFIAKWALDAGEVQLFLFLTPLLGLWAWLWIKLSRLLKSRRAEISGAGGDA
ncbi:MAG: hypothetical protein HYZ45_14845 [Burkholderiales bacterium]|nr:hypothetical protein [Burkholderiales bacterium]